MGSFHSHTDLFNDEKVLKKFRTISPETHILQTIWDFSSPSSIICFFHFKEYSCNVVFPFETLFITCQLAKSVHGRFVFPVGVGRIRLHIRISRIQHSESIYLGFDSPRSPAAPPAFCLATHSFTARESWLSHCEHLTFSIRLFGDHQGFAQVTSGSSNQRIIRVIPFWSIVDLQRTWAIK